MSATWAWDPGELTATLEAAGYDVTASEQTAEGGGSLAARLDRPGRTIIIRLDAGGRLRVTISRQLHEDRQDVEVAGVPFRQVTDRRQTLTLSGTLTSATPLPAILEHVDGLRLPDDVTARRSATAGDGPW